MFNNQERRGEAGGAGVWHALELSNISTIKGARFSMHWSRQTFQQSRAEMAAGGGGHGERDGEV